jgi:predicted cobalt transporter CbtA
MNPLPLGTTLRAAVLAALLAGLVVAGFHRVATEPVIDEAITFEEAASHGHEAVEEPVVSRDAQRVGLFVGIMLYGLTWALFFAAAYQLSQGWLPASTPAARAALLVLAAYFAVALFPFLKYPANPPGVGEPDTVVFRQQVYVLSIVVGVAGAGLALGLARRMRPQAKPIRWVAPLAFLIVFGLVAFVAMPNNPDPVRLPTDLIVAFRTLSLIGLTIFWLLFGASFSWLIRGEGRRAIAAT